MFVVMIAFIGLASDAGILYVTYGQFRRAVDSAALAAASQYREARSNIEIEANAQQFIQLQGFYPSAFDVEDCEELTLDYNATAAVTIAYPPVEAYNTTDPENYNPNSAVCTYPVRKLVRVRATNDVHPVFLPMFRLFPDTVPITVDAVAEAASLEIMLVIDTSPSMNSDNAAVGTLDSVAECNSTSYGASGLTLGTDLPSVYSILGVDYSPVHSCRPFEWVRDAAVRFVHRFVKFPFDRVGIVTFSNTATVVQSLSSTGASQLQTTLLALKGLDVSTPASSPPSQLGTCDSVSEVQGDYGKCAATNTGSALAAAKSSLDIAARQNALRFIILLSDGAVNGSADNAATAFDPDTYACPKNAGVDHDLSTNPNYDVYMDTYDLAFSSYLRECQDGDARASTYHDDNDVLYDADDYARDQANEIANGGNTIVFTVGLGSAVTWNPDGSSTPACPTEPLLSGVPVGFNFGYGGPLGDGNVPEAEFLCNADARANGEQLLRYIADVGDGDGLGDSSDPCGRVTTGSNEGLYLFDSTDRSCGNYFFASGGAELNELFESIANHIFTRITK